MITLLEQALRFYDKTRHSGRLLHHISRQTARLFVRMYAKLKRFQLPSEQPYNYRYLTNTYEPGTTMVVKKILKPGMVAVDIGAHVGYYTKLFARLTGKHGKVYAFEPHPNTFAVLEHNTKRFLNVIRFNMAVLDREDDVLLYESSNSGANSLWPMSVRGGPTGSVLVKGVTLDKVLSNIWPDLVKLDVEGSELDVLQGMRFLLAGPTNLSLIVEWNPLCLVGRGVEPGMLLETIDDLGFKISSIDEATGKVQPINIYSDARCPLDRGRKYINLLCNRQ